MASSSSQKTHKDFNYNYNNPLEEKEKESRDFLELGLGLGFSNECKKLDQEQSNPVSAFPSSSSSSQFQAHHQIALGLGLGLGLPRPGLGGFDNGVGVTVTNVTPPSSNYNRLWKNQQDQDRNDDDRDEYQNMMASWPWHMGMDMDNYSGSFLGLLQDWQMPVPNNSHDYSTGRRARPHSGLWFTLHSSTNRDGEALPQIPKAYIRVKDENVTVFMVKKYLVRKLGLSNEAEIDISCMGQNLLHTQTLKQVRDSVWLPRMMEFVNSGTVSFENSHNSSINHLMSLNYARQCTLN